jgi:hypothetical protein
MLNVVISRTGLIQSFIIGLVLLAFTFLRPVLFFLFPVIFILIIAVFHYSIPKNRFLALILSLIPPAVGFWVFQDSHWSNFLVSLILVIPPIFLFFGKIGIEEKRLDFSYLDYFIKIATLILLLSNLYGFYQLIRKPGDDDSFIGFYGVHGLAMHTLSLMNFIICVFYFYKYRYYHLRKHLYWALFFFLSAFACFFGLGLIAFCLTILLLNFKLNLIRRFLNRILLFGLIFIMILGAVILIRPQTLSYNLENIERATRTLANFGSLKVYTDEELAHNYDTPRKFILYYYYAKVYFSDLQLFLLGNGPGTFNSRTSFLLNGDYSQNKLIELAFGFNQPQLASAYVYPLWNSKLLSRKFKDGTRNEPFSAIIALLAEYGFLFFLLVALVVKRTFKSLIAKGNFLLSTEFAFNNKVQHYLSFIRFTAAFVLINLFLDNYLEYPEVILVFILLFNLTDLYFNSVIEKHLGEDINNS